MLEDEDFLEDYAEYLDSADDLQLDQKMMKLEQPASPNTRYIQHVALPKANSGLCLNFGATQRIFFQEKFDYPLFKQES